MSSRSPDTGTAPLVGIPTCSQQIGIHPSQAVGNKYINAAVEGAGVMPLLIPSMGEQMLPCLAGLDGLLLTGSYSNVAPHLYGAEPVTENPQGDEMRDSTTLPLIRAAVDQGVPVLGICRGFQEINVALGGTLHQQLWDVPGLMEHREDKNLTLEQQYDIAHGVTLNPNGLLAQLMKGELEQGVNSLHGQGVDQLAPTLRVEATAPDGLVEAFSLDTGKGFLLAAQWHPEWKLLDNPFYLSLFKAFGAACQQRQSARQPRLSQSAQ